jgi:hypothetical protein
MTIGVTTEILQLRRHAGFSDRRRAVKYAGRTVEMILVIAAGSRQDRGRIVACQPKVKA